MPWFGTLQARRDHAEMELSSRSHEMLMGEMAVLVRGYRREQTRLYEVNRALAQRLEELERKVRNRLRTEPYRRKIVCCTRQSSVCDPDGV